MRKMVYWCSGIIIIAGMAAVLGLEGLDLWSFTAQTVNTGTAVLSALAAALAGVFLFAARSRDKIGFTDSVS